MSTQDQLYEFTPTDLGNGTYKETAFATPDNDVTYTSAMVNAGSYLEGTITSAVTTFNFTNVIGPETAAPTDDLAGLGHNGDNVVYLDYAAFEALGHQSLTGLNVLSPSIVIETISPTMQDPNLGHTNQTIPAQEIVDLLTPNGEGGSNVQLLGHFQDTSATFALHLA